MSAYDDAKDALVKSGFRPQENDGGGITAEAIFEISCGIAEDKDGDTKVLLGLNGRLYSATPKLIAQILVDVASMVSKLPIPPKK